MFAASAAISRTAFETRSKRASGSKRDEIVIACSHTHSGPVVGNNLMSMYKLDSRQIDLVTAIRRVARRNACANQRAGDEPPGGRAAELGHRPL